MGLRRIHIPQLIVFGVLALGACADKEGEFFEQVAQERNKISFGVYTVGTQSGTGTGAKTRVLMDKFVDSTQFKVGRRIGVFAFYHDNSTWEKTSRKAKPNFMFDQEVTKVSADSTVKWSYSPVKYWPNEHGTQVEPFGEEGKDTLIVTESEGIDRLSFFGYYPYSATGDGEYYNINFMVSDSDDIGRMGEWKFVQKEKAAENVDFMMSDLVPNLTKDSVGVNGIVNLKFHHLLSQVWCTYQLADSLANNDHAWLTIDSIRLEGIYDRGTLLPKYDTLTKKTNFPWTVDSTHTQDFIARNLEHLDSMDALSRRLLVIPQKIPATVATKCWYTIHFPADSLNPNGYSYTGNYYANHLAGCKDKNGNVINEWEMSKRYRYLVTVGLYTIKFNCEVAPWEDREYNIIEVE